MGTTLSALATNALLARLLSPRELGVYFLAFSLVMFGAQVGSLGLNQAVVRFVAVSLGLNLPGRIRRVVILALGVGTLGAISVGFLYLLLGGTLAEELFHSPALVAVTGLVAGWMIIMTLQLLLSETFRGLHHIDLATIFGGLATGTLLTAGLGTLWLVNDGTTLAIVMLLAMGSSLASCLLAGWILNREIARLPSNSSERWLSVGEILRVSSPMLISSLTLLAITQADIWIVGAFRPPDDVAVYGAAARTVLLISMPLLVVNGVIPPLIAEMYVQGRTRELERVIRTTVSLAVIPALAMLVVFVFLGGTILGLVYGEFYSQGAILLALLSVGHLTNVWAGPCGTALVMTGHQTTMMIVTFLTVVFVFGGALWVVRVYGPIGVASVAAMSMILQNTLSLLLARKQTGLWTHASLSILSLRRAPGQVRG